MKSSSWEYGIINAIDIFTKMRRNWTRTRYNHH